MSPLVDRLRAAGCIYAEDEAALILAESSDADAVESMVARRIAGEPLEYVLGWAEFLGRRYRVEPGCFVPRHRTELLVRLAIGRARSGAVILDMCCGTGALGDAVAAGVPGSILWASDIDARSARLNLDPDHVFEGDLFVPLPAQLRGTIDVLVCNTPYVPTTEIDLLPREARLFERVETLDGGFDGLDVQRRLALEVGEWLAPGGVVLVEVAAAQARASAALFENRGMTTAIEVDDDTDTTVVIARQPVAQPIP